MAGLNFSHRKLFVFLNLLVCLLCSGSSEAGDSQTRNQPVENAELREKVNALPPGNRDAFAEEIVSRIEQPGAADILEELVKSHRVSVDFISKTLDADTFELVEDMGSEDLFEASSHFKRLRDTRVENAVLRGIRHSFWKSQDADYLFYLIDRAATVESAKLNQRKDPLTPREEERFLLYLELADKLSAEHIQPSLLFDRFSQFAGSRLFAQASAEFQKRFNEKMKAIILRDEESLSNFIQVAKITTLMTAMKSMDHAPSQFLFRKWIPESDKVEFAVRFLSNLPPERLKPYASDVKIILHYMTETSVIDQPTASFNRSWGRLNRQFATRIGKVIYSCVDALRKDREQFEDDAF